MNMLEVLFTTSINEKNTTCTAVDPKTGTEIMTYKSGGNTNKRTLCVVSNEYIIGANISKPLIHVWPINAQNQITSARFVTPGKVSAIAVTPDGVYLMAGVGEIVYVWHLQSGKMLNALSKHYQPITCIRTTDEGSHFVSASNDGAVLLWNLTLVVGRDVDSQQPIHSFSDHGLPVTDVHIGVGGLRAHMFTISLDRSCKLYDLFSRAILLNVVFPESLSSVIVNVLETSLYVGTLDGPIYHLYIKEIPKKKEHDIPMEYNNKFTGHKKAVNAMAVSCDTTTLISGGEDSQIYIWHIPTYQVLKTFSLKGPVTNLLIRLSSRNVFNRTNRQTFQFVNSLRRMIDQPQDDEFEVTILSDGQRRPEEKEQMHEELIKCIQGYEHPYTNHQKHKRIENCDEDRSKNSSSKDENKRLIKEIERLQMVNRKLFEEASKNVLHISK